MQCCKHPQQHQNCPWLHADFTQAKMAAASGMAVTFGLVVSAARWLWDWHRVHAEFGALLTHT